MTDFSKFPRFQLFHQKCVLALDYGTVAIGTALFKPGNLPFPICLERIIVKENKNYLYDLKNLIDNEFVEIIVLGLPRHADGKESEMTKKVLKFKEIILNTFKLPVYLQDETYSTEEAKRRMESSAEFNFKIDLKKIDSVAAQIILEDFFTSTAELD
jgi:putative Holliday junction resolvase